MSGSAAIRSGQPPAGNQLGGDYTVETNYQSEKHDLGARVERKISKGNVMLGIGIALLIIGVALAALFNGHIPGLKDVMPTDDLTKIGVTSAGGLLAIGGAILIGIGEHYRKTTQESLQKSDEASIFDKKNEKSVVHERFCCGFGGARLDADDMPDDNAGKDPNGPESRR